MTLDPYREQLGAFVLDQLDPWERPGVQAHVDGCPDCRAQVVELRPVVARLLLVDPNRLTGEVPVPPHLGELVVERVRRERRRRVPRWAGLAAAAVLIAVVAGGIGWSAGRPSVPLEPVAIGHTAAGVAARAALVAHTWGVEIKLEATGFTAGEAYRVMIGDRQGREVSAGTFVGTGDAPMACNLNSSVPRSAATGFTVLDASGEVVLSSGF